MFNLDYSDIEMLIFLVDCKIDYYNNLLKNNTTSLSNEDIYVNINNFKSLKQKLSKEL